MKSGIDALLEGEKGNYTSLTAWLEAQKLNFEDIEVQILLAEKHFDLAQLYRHLDQIESALIELQKAIELRPDHLHYRLFRAETYQVKGFSHRSFQELNDLKREFPKNPLPSYHLGQLHASQANYLDAEMEWEQSLSIDPDFQPSEIALQASRQARHKEPSPFN